MKGHKTLAFRWGEVVHVLSGPAQCIVGIDRLAVVAKFEVQVGTRRSAGLADGAELRLKADVVASLNVQRFAVRVA